MLDQISLKNFKSAQDLEIPLKPLTVLSGLNGSGKSTVLQSLALLRQSLDPHNLARSQSLRLRGPLVQIGSAVDLLSESSIENQISIVLNSDGEIGTLVATVSDSSAYEISFEIEGPATPFIAIEGRPFQYLQADRLMPRAHYDRSDEPDEIRLGFLGALGQYTPDYIATHGDRLEVSERRRCSVSGTSTEAELMGRIVGTPKLADQISGWLQILSPGVRISASRVSETDLVSLRFQYASTSIGHDSRHRRPGNVGFGLTYSLPIVTALLASPKGTLLLLENPEAHLHPRGQAALGALIAKVASDDVQIIVETHSDHVLNGIRLAVKNKLIEAGDCQVNNFVRDLDSATSYIEQPTILPSGELSTWPDGFFDEWEKSLQALLT